MYGATLKALFRQYLTSMSGRLLVVVIVSMSLAWSIFAEPVYASDSNSVVSDDDNAQGSVGAWNVSADNQSAAGSLSLRPHPRASLAVNKNYKTELASLRRLIVTCMPDQAIAIYLSRIVIDRDNRQNKVQTVPLAYSLNMASLQVDSWALSQYANTADITALQITPDLDFVALVPITKDTVKLLRMLYNEGHNDLEVTLSHNEKRFYHSVYRPVGFSQAFDSACGSHEGYTEISNKPVRVPLKPKQTLIERAEQLEKNSTNPVIVQRMTRKLKKINATALKAAIEKEDLSEIKRILKENQHELLKFSMIDGAKVDSLYNASLKLGNAKIVSLMLGAGADVNQVLGDSWQRELPLNLATEHADIETMRVLLDAGAKISNAYGDANAPGAISPVFAAIDSGDVTKLQLLYERGASLQTRTLYSWTPLMHAIWLQDEAMIEYILANSHPFARISYPSTGEKLITGETLTYLPALNALFLAKRVSDIDADELVASIHASAAEFGDEQAILEMKRASYHSDGLMALYEGRADDAFDALTQEIGLLNVHKLSFESETEDIKTAMSALLEKHRAAVIGTHELSVDDRQAITNISELGGWNQPIHDLFDLLQYAEHKEANELLAQWESTHGNPHLLVWESARLVQWATMHTDSDAKARLEAVLGLFDLQKK